MAEPESQPRTMKCGYCGVESNKLKACSACKKVAYCSKEHQREHWKDHKKACKPSEKKADAPNPHIRAEDAPDVPVTWEDQKNINAFGRLNNKLGELKDEIKTKKKALENIEDASGEIETLLDDNACIIKVGEVYVNASNEEAEQHVAHAKEETQAALRTLTAQHDKIVAQMSDLKKVLYGKFGKSINLEAPEEDES